MVRCQKCNSGYLEEMGIPILYDIPTWYVCFKCSKLTTKQEYEDLVTSALERAIDET